MIYLHHGGLENFKNSRQKTREIKYINQFHEIAFLAVLYFFPVQIIDFLAIYEIEFGQKKIIREIELFDVTSFLAWTFLNYVAHCVGVGPLNKWYCQ